MKTIVVANHKGGVGKTTTSLSLGAGLHRKGFKVLLVDLDPQLNLSYTCGIYKHEDLKGCCLFDYFHRHPQNITIDNCIFQIYDDRVDFDIIVGGMDLRNAEKDKDISVDSLKKALMNLSVDYDYVVIDVPPTQGKLVKMAITAADDIIIPIKPDVYSVQGLGSLIEVIHQANPDINLVGLLMIEVKHRTTFNRVLLDEADTLAQKYGTKLFNQYIHSSIKIPESQAKQQSIYDYAPRNTVAKDYESFVDEYLKGV